MEAVTNFELSKEYLDRFQEALTQKDDQFIISSLQGINATDISALLDEFDSEECKYVFDLLPTEVNAAIFRDLDEDVQREFADQFSSVELAEMIENLDSDDGADILMVMNLRRREEVIDYIQNQEKATYLLDLLRYDEDVAGGLMAKELIKANLNWSIRQCIEEIRKQAENVEKIYSVYVVDNKDVLLGKVSLKKVILAEDNVKVSSIYEPDIESVDTQLREEDVAAIMQKYDLEAVPVVNALGRLVGRITIDDVVDVITEIAEEERQIMSGISSDVEEDDSVWTLSKARLPWLIIGMAGGLFAAQITDVYREDIALITGLALFIPLIMAMAGNVGIQSSSIVVQSLATKSAFTDSMLTRLIKVLVVAIVNGAILSLMVFGAVILIFKDQPLSFTVSIALFSVVLLSSLMGTITPLILDKFGVNPALASGPFITTANDLVGLVVYFSVAHMLYNL